MLLLVGLGNPGRRYAGHRHNVGFMAADEIHRRQRFSAWRARFEGEISEGLLGGEKAYVLKPATFMNDSGRAVRAAMDFFKKEIGDVTVFHDELDLAPFKVKVKTGGGTAGHKGLKSIEAHIGKEFRRMRIGIGHPGARELVNGYVLHDFGKADRDWLDPLLSAVAEHAPLLATGDDSTFMNRVHLAVARESDPIATAPLAPARPAPPRTADRGMGGALADGLKRLLGRGS